MTGDYVYGVLCGAKAFLAPVVKPWRIDLDPDFLRGNGDTSEIVGGNTVFTVGCAGLEGNFSELSDYDAAEAIVALFHEVCGHGGQLKYEFAKKTNLSRILAMNYYACKSSPLYYDGNAKPGEITEQYLRQPHEIAAEYMALKSARSYLPRVLGDKPGDAHDPAGRRRTDELLLLYANTRARSGKWFSSPKRDFKNMREVLNELDSRFQACYDAHRDYAFGHDTPDGYAGAVLAQYELNQRDSSCGLKSWQAQYVSDCGHGVHQDLMLCAAARRQWPDYKMLLDKPALTGISWAYDHVFKYQSSVLLPKAGLRPMQRLNNMVEDAARMNNRDGLDPDGPDIE